MRTAIIAALVVSALSGSACQSPANPELAAEVVHVNAPTYFEDDIVFGYEGQVKNVGTVTAKQVLVTVNLHRNDGTLINSGSGYARVGDRNISTGVGPGEVGSWYAKFFDFGGPCRAQMDSGKTAFKITWEAP